MSKNAEGWVRHRGGKCPVEIGDIIDVRHRSGEVISCVEIEGSGWYWDHHGNSFDIMAYRLRKPAEQVEACSKPELQINLPCGYGEICNAQAVEQGPLQWRDRITEIDATTQALTTERADLVQRLAGEGFALIGWVVEPVEDMSDWRNWRAGDFLECVTVPADYKGYYSTGNAYELAVNDISDDKYPVSVMSERGITLWCRADCFKFSHRDPSA